MQISQTPSRKTISAMFDAISPTYDRANRILSLGLDLYWRRILSQQLPSQPISHLLDIATGTGDQIISILKEFPKANFTITGIDMSPHMLELAREKIKKVDERDRVEFLLYDAGTLPFEDEAIDCITISFGVRNFINLHHCLKEMFRILRKKGRMLILEFALPSNPIIKNIHLQYLRHIVPLLGKSISKHPTAYRYLNQTIEVFPYGKSFASLLQHIGFNDVQIISLTFGIVNIYVAQK